MSSHCLTNRSIVLRLANIYLYKVTSILFLIRICESHWLLFCFSNFQVLSDGMTFVIPVLYAYKFSLQHYCTASSFLSFRSQHKCHLTESSSLTIQDIPVPYVITLHCISLHSTFMISIYLCICLIFFVYDTFTECKFYVGRSCILFIMYP